MGVVGNSSPYYNIIISYKNKKVLLRERKRHTALRVASTRYVVPVAGTPILGSDLDWGGVPAPSPSWDLTWMGRGYLPLCPPTPAPPHPGIWPGWGGGTCPAPHPGSDLDGGYLPCPHSPCHGIWPGWGVPDPPLPCPLSWDLSWMRGRYLSPPDLGRGTPPPISWMVVPPPPGRGVNWHTNWNYYLPSSFGCGR